MSDLPSHVSSHNVKKDKDLGPVVIGLDFAVFAVSTTVVLIRLHTRLWITRNFGWDDAASALTQVAYRQDKVYEVFSPDHRQSPRAPKDLRLWK